METPPPPEPSNTTIRPDLLIRVKRGSITETISDAFTSRFRRRQASRSPLPSPSSSPFHPSHALLKMVSKITLKDIEGSRRCGGGGFGTVRLFEHPTQGTVALKQLLVLGRQLSDDLRRRTLREGETWQILKHPYVLPFLGILETPTDLYLVSPYVKNGALDEYLRHNPDVDRREILWKTACAIAYLHERRIIHGDIKAANILVSDNVEPLLCDFGLAKSDDGTTSAGLQGVGTVRFQSPEVLIEGSGKSFASDIWAFGMTISEVLSGKLPFHQYTIPTAIISAIVLRDERPPTLPSHSPFGLSYDPVWNVARGCWQKNPGRRTSMQDTCRRLRPNGVALRGHTAWVNCLAILPDGRTILSGSGDDTLRLWDVTSGSQRGEALTGHTDSVNCLAITPDGMTAVSGSGDRTLRLWDVASGMQRGEALTGHTDSITCLAITPDGMILVSGSRDRTLRRWDVASGSQRGEASKKHTDSINCLAITPDSKTFVFGSKDDIPRLSAVVHGSHQDKRPRGFTDSINCLAITPDGMTLIFGSIDRCVVFWDVASDSQRGGGLEVLTGGVSCLTITPDGMTTVSGSVDRTLRLWDVVSGTPRGEALKGHTDGISCLAITPDGLTVVSGSLDGTLRLWDVASGCQRGEVLKGHTRGISCLVITPDGMTIVSGSRDGTLRLWDVAPQSQRIEPLEVPPKDL